MTSPPRTATHSEHAKAIKAAIKAAEDDGYKLEYWPWRMEDGFDLTINLIELRRVNGYMRVVQREQILEVEGL